MMSLRSSLDQPVAAESGTLPDQEAEQDPLLALPDAQQPEYLECGPSEHIYDDREASEERSPWIYTLFLLLGGGALLGWNSFIVSLPYFSHSVLGDSEWSHGFGSALSFVLTVANLVSIVLAIRSQKRVNPQSRNVRSLIVLIVLLLSLVLFTTQPSGTLSPPLAYFFLLATAAGVSAAGSYLQTASKCMIAYVYQLIHLS